MEYSVIIPVYNSANIQVELVDRLMLVMKELAEPYEVFLIDDGSNDDSWDVLKKLKKQHDHLKVIRLAKNFGQHNATLCGLQNTEGAYIITLDDDLQHAPEDIPELIEVIRKEDCDVVYGIPNNLNYKPKGRKMASRAWNGATKRIDEGEGEGSSFRVMRRALVNSIGQHQHHFVYIDEILGWFTSAIVYHPITFHKSKREQSSYSYSKLIGMGFNLALFYSNVPLKLMTYGGLAMSVISMLVGCYFILKKIFIGTAVPGYTSIIVSIFFSTSLILICLGIIGQYLGRIHSTLNNKPSYSIRERLL